MALYGCSSMGIGPEYYSMLNGVMVEFESVGTWMS
jgi:hypothetical protein